MAIARAEQSNCGHAGVRVDGSTHSVHSGAACEAIRDTWGYFRRIGISSEPKLSVHFEARGLESDKPSHSGYAYADRGSSRIVVFVSSGRRPWGLPWSDAWVRSFLRHELVHVAVWHFLGARARALPREWHEFVAYAIQLELMEPAMRSRVLANFAAVRPFDRFAEVNEFTYGMDPEAFAVAAYRTYRQGGEGKFILDVLTKAAQGWDGPPPLPR